MPKLLCPCGYVHDLSGIPDNGWQTMKDAAADAVDEARERCYTIARHAVPPADHPRLAEWDQAMATIGNATGRLYECPDCGRLMWQRDGEQLYRIFHPADDEAAGKRVLSAEAEDLSEGTQPSGLGPNR